MNKLKYYGLLALSVALVPLMVAWWTVAFIAAVPFALYSYYYVGPSRQARQMRADLFADKGQS